MILFRIVSYFPASSRSRDVSNIVLVVLPTIFRIDTNVQTMRSKLDKDEDIKILDWLTPVDYGP